jgi:hypothetical protein
MLGQELTRRTVLQLAAGWGVSFAVPGLAPRAADRRGPERQKSLLVVWLQGGASQLETWDPHPGTAIGGPAPAVASSIPGAQICGWFPRMAEQLHHLCVVRSLVSKEGDHERGTYLLRTGYRPDPSLIHPALGAIAVHQRPSSSLEIPQFISLGENDLPSRGGYLGDEYDPYRVFTPGENGANLESGVTADRQKQRLDGLNVIDRSFRQGRGRRVERTLHQHTINAALRMMSSEQLKAFSVESESAAVRAAYGETPFGRGCLVARRLLETGVRAVEVTQGGFDTHADNFTGHRLRAELMDPALASLFQDLRDRDLWQSTVVLVIGEFGRTPTINPLDGRDHWPTGFSCLVGGGGLAAGRVIGATDPEGKRTAPENPVEIADLFATVLQTLGIDYQRELLTPIGRPMKLSEGRPVEALLA